MPPLRDEILPLRSEADVVRLVDEQLVAGRAVPELMMARP